MLILSSGPLRTGSTVWQTRSGSYVLTVVSKTTYWLKPGESSIAAEQEAVNETDDHWDDDPNRSVRAPSDLTPNKIRPEVTLVGYAYAPGDQPVRSLVARLVVGDVDKSIEVYNDRAFLPDGTLQEGQRFTRMRLNWERAGGGPGTSNPVGVRPDVRDAYGRKTLPNLQPLGLYVSSPDDFVPPIGFGPIAASWPSRADLVGRAPPAYGEGLDGPTAAYFNAAPQDQQLSVLRDNERIVLENLHAEHPRLVTNLSGHKPAIFVERASGHPSRVNARADSLWIDTDRGIVTLTWRALIPLAQKDESGRIFVVLEAPGRELTFAEAARAILGSESDDVEDAEMLTITSTAAPVHPSAALPFAASAATQSPLPPRARSEAAAAKDLPFHLPGKASTPPPAPPPAPKGSPPTRPPMSTTLGMPAPPPVPPAPVRPSAVSLPDLGPPPQEKPRAPASPWAGGTAGPVVQPQTIGSQAVAAAAAAATVEAPKEAADGGRVLGASTLSKPLETAAASPPPAPLKTSRPATSFDAAFGGGKSTASTPAAPPQASRPSTGFDSSFGSAKAASDAAAARSEEPPPRERTARNDVDASQQASRRQAVVTLLSFDAQIVPRLRRSKRFAQALGLKGKSRRSQGLDEPVKEAPPDDRNDVLRVLCYGQPIDAAEVRRVFADCLDDVDELEPPLVLVAGEMRPTFDELETLRTTIAVAQLVARGDKKVLSTVAVGQEALAAPIAPRPETTLGLVRQIEQAAASLSLPTRYVPAEVERLLAEGRKYKRRTLLGAPRLRADLALSRGGEVLPIYLPESASNSLPLLLSFPVIALCDVTPREDLLEAQDEALIVSALGRVLRSR